MRIRILCLINIVFLFIYNIYTHLIRDVSVFPQLKSASTTSLFVCFNTPSKLEQRNFNAQLDQKIMEPRREKWFVIKFATGRELLIGRDE